MIDTPNEPITSASRSWVSSVRTVAETAVIARLLEEAGADAIDVSAEKLRKCKELGVRACEFLLERQHHRRIEQHQKVIVRVAQIHEKDGAMASGHQACFLVFLVSGGPSSPRSLADTG